MNTKNTTRKGFTTVELVIVIAVIAILAVVLVPTFSNLIEKANLSSDKQNVRNMNICLTTEIASQIKANKPEAFGTVRAMLKEYGYGKDDNFKAKTKGHSFRWFIDDRGDNDKSNDKSVIALVDDSKMKIVFPEEYTNWDIVKDGTVNIRKYFDMSLPGAVVTKDTSGHVINAQTNQQQEITVMYTFEPIGNTNADVNYDSWNADFYISLRKGEDAVNTQSEIGAAMEALKEVQFAGYYYGWFWGGNGDDVGTSDEECLILLMSDVAYFLGQNNGQIALVEFMTDGGKIPYATIRSMLSGHGQNKPCIFKCGLYDKDDGSGVGYTLSVELCLTNDTTGEEAVLGVFEYEFK